PLVTQVRGAGLLIGIELAEPTAGAVAKAAQEAGFLVNPVRPDTVRLAPPLILSEHPAEAFLAAVPAALDAGAATWRGPGRAGERGGGSDDAPLGSNGPRGPPRARRRAGLPTGDPEPDRARAHAGRGGYRGHPSDAVARPRRAGCGQAARRGRGRAGLR